MAAIENHRYEALDAWRGICACLVAMLHFDSYSHIYALPLIHNAYLLVDFFFVLSGFVMAANYATRLNTWNDGIAYAIARFARLYPLHIFMVALFIGYEALRLIPLFEPLSETKPFSAFGQTPVIALANLFLVQPLLGWNGFNPLNWSIATEFYICLFYGLAMIVLKRRTWLLALPLFLLAPLFFAVSDRHMDTLTYCPAYLRCLYGFATGVLVYHLHKASQSGPAIGIVRAGVCEILVVIGAALFVSFGYRDNIGSVFAPYVFGAVVIVFAQEQGVVSRLLRHRIFLWLGALSYSIYLIHVFIQMLIYDAIDAIERHTGAVLETKWMFEGEMRDHIFTNRWVGDLAYIPMMAIVLLCAHGTYKWIEMPSRRWLRREMPLGIAHLKRRIKRA